MAAARTGHVDAIKALLARGAAVNAHETWRNQTALMWAAVEGHPDAVAELVRTGADVKLRSIGGFTALMFAVRGGHVERRAGCSLPAPTSTTPRPTARAP